MPIFKRLTYSLYILIATTMIVVLALSIGEGVGLIPDFNAAALMFHPMYILVVCASGFALAPKLHEMVPISGKDQGEDTGSKQPISFGVRVAVLSAMGLVIALFSNLIVYLLGESI